MGSIGPIDLWTPEIGARKSGRVERGRHFHQPVRDRERNAAVERCSSSALPLAMIPGLSRGGRSLGPQNRGSRPRRRGTGEGSLSPIPLRHSPQEPSCRHEEPPIDDMGEFRGTYEGARTRFSNACSFRDGAGGGGRRWSSLAMTRTHTARRAWPGRIACSPGPPSAAR
jgi:hypothetical protein